MNELRCKVLVIGGGPGGYVAAIRAGQLGLDTILVEAERLGGACLNVGCIPSKALIHAADAAHALTDADALNAIGLSIGRPKLDFARTIAWKDSIVARLTTGVGALLKKAQVRTLNGPATIVDGKTAIAHVDTGEQRIRCEHLVIATGSEPMELDALPFGGDVMSSTQALALTKVPRSLAVVGAGYIGMELGMAFAKLGAKVTIVEALGKILPLYDQELTQPVGAPPRRSRCRDDPWRARARLRRRRAARRRRGRRRKNGRGRQGAGRGRAARPHARLRAGSARSDDERPVPAHRRPMRDLDAQRLGDRRRHRRADARPSRDGSGSDGRRDHRRRKARVRPGRDSGDLFHRSGDRRGGACRPTPPRRRTEKSGSACFRSAPTGGR